MPEIVQEIGAYAGLASVLGLALLSALYFSQARDVKRLREWAGRAPERSEQTAPAVAGRVVAQPQQPQQPAAAQRPAPPPVPGAPAVAGARPAAATPAPATPAAATPAAASAAGAAAATATTPGKPAGDGTPDGKDASGKPAPVAPSPGTPPATAKPDAAPGAAQPASPPAAPTPPRPPAPPAARPATPAGGRGGAPAVPSGEARFASRPGVTSRHSPQETAILPPRPTDPWHRRLGAGYLALALVVLLVLGGAAAYGVTQLTGDDSGSQTPEQRAGGGSSADDEEGTSEPRRSRGGVRPGSVTVAVLNGTTVPGLAATLSDEVSAAGFKIGTIANFADQQLAESVVQYAPGHEPEARAVSRRLGITQREPVNPSSQALAGDATVIVIAGGDKAP
ncbi:MAG: hypothetical protein QOH58_1917 [Thermoleophilaceae bacterium]|nr:hypothetical protein [Thermoleophilaceae bacterium]